MMLTVDADPEVVEELVAHMMEGLQHAGVNFSVSDGLSAAMTFAYRFSRVVVLLSPDDAAKKTNAMRMASTLRRMAAQLELQEDEGKGTVH